MFTWLKTLFRRKTTYSLPSNSYAEIKTHVMRAPVPDFTPEPKDCPKCNGMLAISGDVVQCAGLVNRVEVEENLGPLFPYGRVPRSVTSKPACKWENTLSEFGKSWI